MFKDIQKSLLGGDVYKYDKMTFEKFHKGKIDIEQCLMEFKVHNKIYEDIDTEVFRKWIQSLGYAR